MANQSELLQLMQLKNARYVTLLKLRSHQTYIAARSECTTATAAEKRRGNLSNLGLDIEMLEDGVDRVNEAIEAAGAPNRTRAALRVSLHNCICSFEWAKGDGLDAGPASEESMLELREHFAAWTKSIALDRTRLADM